MATKTKKKAPATPPAPCTPVFLPAKYEADTPLDVLLLNTEMFASHETFTPAQLIDAAIAALRREDAGAVRQFARQVAWLMGGSYQKEQWLGDTGFPAARRADLVAPTCLANGIAFEDEELGTITVTLHEDVVSAEAIAAWATDRGQSQVIDEAVETALEIRYEVSDSGAQQLALVSEEEAPAKKVTGMDFQSADEAQSVASALEGRAEDLEKEAKRLTDLKRNAEARNLLREAKHIRETLLPQVAPQLAIPFNAAESPVDALTRVVGGPVRKATVRAMTSAVVVGEGETYEEVIERRKAEVADFERVVGHIAEHSAAALMPVLREAVERAVEAGRTERRTTAESLVREAVQAIAAAQLAVA